MGAPSPVAHTQSETAAFQSTKLLTAIDALCKQFAEPGLQPIFFHSHCNLNCNTQHWPAPRNRQWEAHIAMGHPLTVFLEKVCQEWYVACTTFLKHFHTRCAGLPLPTSLTSNCLVAPPAPSTQSSLLWLLPFSSSPFPGFVPFSCYSSRLGQPLINVQQTVSSTDQTTPKRALFLLFGIILTRAFHLSKGKALTCLTVNSTICFFKAT